MKRIECFVLAVVALSQICCGEVVWQLPQEDRQAWGTVFDFASNMSFAYDATRLGRPCALLARGKSKKETDTAWGVTSKRIALSRGAKKFAFSYCLGANFTCLRTKESEAFGTSIAFFDDQGRPAGSGNDAQGKSVSRLYLPGLLRKDAYERFRMVGKIPKGAATFEVRLGFDDPNVIGEREAYFADVKVEVVSEDAPCGVERPDIDPPAVFRLSKSPTEDAYAPLRFGVKDPSGLDLRSVKIAVDGTDMTDSFVRSDENVWELPKPATAWTKGLHRVTFTVADKLGNTNVSGKAFFIGARPDVPSVRLREDGVTLLDGRPFFPIGVFGVRKAGFNLWNYDRAIADLKEAGFNFTHTYLGWNDPEYYAAVRKHGLMTLAPGRDVGPWQVEKMRDYPCVLAWYMADDTSDNSTPEQIHDYLENAHAMDGRRLTTHADALGPGFALTKYAPFAKYTESFMPELYPVHDNGRDSSNCVARIIQSMDCIASENERFGGRLRHAVWPLLGHMRGFGAWFRYPTSEELLAMSFAAIVKGAKGLVLYTYSPAHDLKVESDLSVKSITTGLIGTESSWFAATNVTRRLSALSPVLTAEGDVHPKVEIVTGTKADAAGNVPVCALVKEIGDERWLIAVNSSLEDVRVRFPDAAAANAIYVLWENRALSAMPTGGFEDVFAKNAVHVYKFARRK